MTSASAVRSGVAVRHEPARRDVCGPLGDADAATVLRRLLGPWAGLNVTDLPEGMRGSVERYLGILAATTEHWSEATRHFDNALA